MTGSILAARFRRLFLLEKLQWYGEALLELDGLEHMAREGIQAWSDTHTESQAELHPEKTKGMGRMLSSHDEKEENHSNVDDEIVPLFVVNATGKMQNTMIIVLIDRA